MTIPAATKNAWLNGQAIDTASAHSGFPGTTGANEISGGSYARKTITVSAASGGSRAMASAVAFDVPISTVRWLGFWSGSTFVFAVPNGGATPKNFMAVPATDLVWSTGHGYADTQKIVFYNGTPPAPLVEGTVYFVRDTLTDSFKVAATAGGAAIDLTAGSSFGCVVCAIIEDVYSIAGTHNLTALTESVPD
jgi:hypothetical protein